MSHIRISDSLGFHSRSTFSMSWHTGHEFNFFTQTKYIQAERGVILASFPRRPPLFLFFSLHSVYNTQKWKSTKNGKGLGTPMQTKERKRGRPRNEAMVISLLLLEWYNHNTYLLLLSDLYSSVLSPYLLPANSK